MSRGDGKSLELTPTGRQLAVDLDSDESLYSKEKRFIGSVRRGITEQLVNRIFYRRTECDQALTIRLETNNGPYGTSINLKTAYCFLG